MHDVSRNVSVIFTSENDIPVQCMQMCMVKDYRSCAYVIMNKNTQNDALYDSKQAVHLCDYGFQVFVFLGTSLLPMDMYHIK